MERKSQLGIIGLGTMGSNLARNFLNHGISITVYNRTFDKTQKFLDKYGTSDVFGVETIEDLVESLEEPKKILIMIKPGKPIDRILEKIVPLLPKGGIIIDGGNSFYKDTIVRAAELDEKSICYVGMGVSGGAEGALSGPSLMPGGCAKSWNELRGMLELIAAKDFSGKPCVSLIGRDGAGHYVKMIHNGIEYAIVQIMAEAYNLLSSIYNLSAPEVGEIFNRLNKGKLESYLFEISVDVLARKDKFNDGYLIDFILDKAAQKGTGKWTAEDGLERGVAAPTIAEAVLARFMSGEKEERKILSEKYKDSCGERLKNDLPLNEFIQVLEDALYSSILISYAQGYHLISHAAKEQNWNIDFKEISRIWQGGCIIRAKILKLLEKAYENNRDYSGHMLGLEEIEKEIKESIKGLRELVGMGINSSVPIPGLSSTLQYFTAITQDRSPANFIQGMRDRWGAHTYERIDKEGNFSTEW